MTTADAIGAFAAAQLARARRENRLRETRVIDDAGDGRIIIGGKTLLNFGGNDYLNLAGSPAITRALRDAAAKCGVGATAAHLVCGHRRWHQKLESAFALAAQKPRALLFSTGYLAAQAAASALLVRGDLIFADKLNHACLNDAALIARARLVRYPHLDYQALARRLAAAPRAARKLIISDAVFSMDGDIADVKALLTLCARYDARLLLDDAHGFGVTAAAPAYYRQSSKRLIYMATFGKAAGVCGAAIAADGDTIDLMQNRARAYMFSTAPPPALAAALCASLIQIRKADGARRRLRELIARFHRGADSLAKWRLSDSNTPIQPLIVNDNQTALAASARLRRDGFFVPAIRPPTTPTPRLRISLSAAHRPGQIDALLAALCRAHDALA